jgi:hypothetical protein
MTKPHLAPPIEKVLRERMEELTTALLGEPSVRRKCVLRFHEVLEFQGEPEINVVSVTIAGSRRGRWYGFIYAEGGGPLDFVCCYAGVKDREGAIQWAELWLAGKLVPVPTYAPASLVGREA